jgi:N-acetylneuraminate synthase
MNQTTELDGLFILDMANNHQGDEAHAMRIVRETGDVVREAGVRAALKFQFRDLDTMIHPAYRSRQDVPHIPRFLATALDRAAYARLTQAVRDAGMVTMATPFDEASVAMIEDLDIEVIKIASCSASDWPLLHRAVQARRPMVVSTAGLSTNKIDRLVSHLRSSRCQFALMHCVAIYPTPPNRLNLNQVAMFRSRYPGIPVGFSTHETPDNMDAIRIAYAKGATLFERHVGIQTDKHKLNAYSSTPETLRKWMQAYRDAALSCGGEEKSPAAPEETASLRSLMRGVYAARPVAKGSAVARDAVFFAMPLQDGQLTSGEWRDGMTADTDYKANEPLSAKLADYSTTPQQIIDGIMLQVKGMLNNARIPVGRSSTIEVSHHYGLDRFREFGCVMIDCINRTYCKKLLILLPRQKHPYHYHGKKEETFQLLHGDMEIELEGHRTSLKPGDTFLVQPGQWHKFHTLDGAIVEEVSTTHFNDDSFYEDEKIAKLPRERRKTVIPNWAV